MSRRIIATGPGLVSLPAPDVGTVRLLVALVRTRSAGGVRVGVAEPLAPLDNALDGIHAGVRDRRHADAGGRAADRLGARGTARRGRCGAWR